MTSNKLDQSTVCDPSGSVYMPDGVQYHGPVWKDRQGVTFVLYHNIVRPTVFVNGRWRLVARCGLLRLIRITWVDAQGNAACIGQDECFRSDWTLDELEDAAVYRARLAAVDLDRYFPVVTNA